MTENNRLDVAMATLNALGQPGTDLERFFAAMQLNGLLLTGASVEVITASKCTGSIRHEWGNNMVARQCRSRQERPALSDLPRPLLQ